MNHNSDRNLLKERVFKALHMLFTVSVFYVFWLLFRYHSLNVAHVKGYRYNDYIVLGFFALYILFARTYNAYLLGYMRIRWLAFSQFVSQAFSVVIIWLAATLGWWQLHSPLWLVVMLAVLGVADCAWSYAANWLYYKWNPQKNAILLYNNEIDLRRVTNVSGKPAERLYKIVKTVCCRDKEYPEIIGMVKEYDAIVISGLDSKIRNGIAKYCLQNSVDGFFLPHIGDVIMHGAEHIQSFSAPVLHVERKKNLPEYLFVKRSFDIFASFCGIVVLSPLMAATAIAIKAYDGGPALYRQTRLTKDGKEFQILKFRSMRVDAEKDGVARLSTGEKDPRITPIGRIVRKCRLDELPQLFNILKGDMTIVGPRPERPEIAEKYYQALPEFKLRLQVKAGLTGYAQVYGKYNTEPYEKLEFDLLYINTMNVLTDLQLMFATFGILFKKESTEGFEEDVMIPGDN